MKFTPAQIGKYLNNGGEMCANCGSGKLDSLADMEIYNGKITQSTICQTCGSTWTDNYQLVGITITNEAG